MNVPPVKLKDVNPLKDVKLSSSQIYNKENKLKLLKEMLPGELININKIIYISSLINNSLFKL